MLTLEQSILAVTETIVRAALEPLFEDVEPFQPSELTKGLGLQTFSVTRDYEGHHLRVAKSSQQLRSFFEKSILSTALEDADFVIDDISRHADNFEPVLLTVESKTLDSGVYRVVIHVDGRTIGSTEDDLDKSDHD